MPGETVSTFDAVLKEVYAKPIQAILNNKIIARQLFQKQQGTWEGRVIRYPVHLGRNQGTGYTSEGGTLPAAGNEIYVETQIPIRYQHGRVQLTIQTMKHSRSNKGAFERAVTQSMQGMTKSMSRDANRAMFGWGLGVLAYVNGDPGTGTTITVDTPGGVTGATHGNRFLNPNMNIAFVNPSNGAIRAGGARSVDTIAAGGASIVLDTAADDAVADNDYIVRAMTASSAVIGDTAYNLEIMGLLGLVDDTTYLTTLHNISRSTYPIWRSAVISSVGPLSADILYRGLDVADQIGEGEIDCLLSHHSVRRAYLTLMEGDRRYDTPATLSKPDAGTSAAKQKDGVFGDIPWKTDKDAPFGMLFGIDSSHFTRWVESEGEWADDDGTILMRVQDVDAYEARYRCFENYSNDRPAGCVRWEGIDATIIVAHAE